MKVRDEGGEKEGLIYRRLCTREGEGVYVKREVRGGQEEGVAGCTGGYGRFDEGGGGSGV